MKALLSLIFFSYTFIAIAQSPNKGIQFFEGSWEEALVESRETGKLIFLDAYASWCGPCKRMTKRTFTNEAVGMFFNEHFINLKVDMEKGEGLILAKEYQVGAYPTLLFLDYEGNVVGERIGALTPKKLLFLGENVQQEWNNQTTSKEIDKVEGIRFFEGSWEEALVKAKETRKPIFLDAYASWCGPCKWMSANTFTDPEVGSYYNEHFINLKIDMEKGEGPMLARQFKIRAYPTLIFFNEEGQIIRKIQGARNPKKFLTIGKKIK